MHVKLYLLIAFYLTKNISRVFTGITVFTNIRDKTIHNLHQTPVFHLFSGITAQIQRHVYQRGRQRHSLFSKLSALVNIF